MKRKWEPAFPYESMRANWSGMSLRDYFAAAALTGLLSNPAFKQMLDNADIQRKDAIADGAFLMADAMLIEREKE